MIVRFLRIMDEMDDDAETTLSPGILIIISKRHPGRQARGSGVRRLSQSRFRFERYDRKGRQKRIRALIAKA